MSTSSVDNIKRFCIRMGVAVMPFVPLPWERYRKALVKDSEKRYESGRWDYMKEIAESHRYSIINGCCEFYKSKDRKILDVGCGEGILQKRVEYSKYVGVDSNAEAIRLAMARENESTRFVAIDAGQEYQPQDLYDVIVFNESLYYIKDPLEVFARYRTFLAHDGIMIVCMFQTYLARRLWKKIKETGIIELTTVKISNDLGFASVIKAYANAPLAPRIE